MSGFVITADVFMGRCTGIQMLDFGKTNMISWQFITILGFGELVADLYICLISFVRSAYVPVSGVDLMLTFLLIFVQFRSNS